MGVTRFKSKRKFIQSDIEVFVVIIAFYRRKLVWKAITLKERFFNQSITSFFLTFLLFTTVLL